MTDQLKDPATQDLIKTLLEDKTHEIQERNAFQKYFRIDLAFLFFVGSFLNLVWISSIKFFVVHLLFVISAI